VYIADTNSGVVRKVAAATGIITTIAGTGVAGFSGDGGPASSAELFYPTGVAVDGFGNLYIADGFNNRVRKVAAATGIIATVAGNGNSGNNSGDGGPATSAVVVPLRVAVDGSGNLYIISGNAIRKVTAATGIIATVAGNGGSGYSGDGGPATNAQFEAVNLAVDGSGDIYIADYYHDVIRKVTAATGIIATVAGGGTAGYAGDGGPATSAKLEQPDAVAVDGAGNLYIADTNNFVIRKVAAATGIITTVAGNGAAGPSPNAGPATLAQLATPTGAALDGSGNLYFVDGGNSVLKLVPASGILSTVAGSGATGYTGDGGPATQASFNGAYGIAVDSSGNVYIADSGNNAIRKVTAATGIITTVISAPVGPAPLCPGLCYPNGVAVDKSGNIYIADMLAISKIAAATGMMATVEYLPPLNSFPGSLGRAAITVDGSGNLYIGEALTVQKVAAATGIIATVAGNGQLENSGDGGPAVNAGVFGTLALATDASGNIYIADADATIRKVAAATGIITTLAATGAQFSAPLEGLTVDSLGNIYVADTGNNRILLLAPENSRPVLSVTKTHAASFTLGQAGATYSVVVSNAANAGTASGPVTVSEVIPNGLTLQSMSGAGWNCSSSAHTCTRSDALRGGTSYPPITVAVNVATDGLSQATNQVTLTGGGQALATAASDTANIVANASAAVVTTVSAASGTAPVTADSIVSLYAVNISTAVFTASAGPPAPLPPALGGVSATITDSSGKTAPIGLIVVTPSQVNAVLPAGLATGEATIDLASVEHRPSDYGRCQPGCGSAVPVHCRRKRQGNRGCPGGDCASGWQSDVHWRHCFVQRQRLHTHADQSRIEHRPSRPGAVRNGHPRRRRRLECNRHRGQYPGDGAICRGARRRHTGLLLWPGSGQRPIAAKPGWIGHCERRAHSGRPDRQYRNRGHPVIPRQTAAKTCA
jgi:sugar lactone lactonase YvrE